MRRGAPWAVGVLGAALLVAGVLTFTAANRVGPPEFGWTTYTGSYAPYQPVDEAYASELTLSFDGWSVLWTGGHLAGVGLAVVGLLVLAVLGGWALGRRAPRGGPPAAR
ncbi:hypothetical protein [Blastococcus sp. SYSU DS0533]